VTVPIASAAAIAKAARALNDFIMSPGGINATNPDDSWLGIR